MPLEFGEKRDFKVNDKVGGNCTCIGTSILCSQIKVTKRKLKLNKNV